MRVCEGEKKKSDVDHRTQITGSALPSFLPKPPEKEPAKSPLLKGLKENFKGWCLPAALSLPLSSPILSMNKTNKYREFRFPASPGKSQPAAFLACSF